MYPVTLLLPPPSFRPTLGHAPTKDSYAPALDSYRTAPSPHPFVQAQGYLAQSIAQEYLQSGLTIEPYARANAAYRRQVPPIPSVNISA